MLWCHLAGLHCHLRATGPPRLPVSTLPFDTPHPPNIDIVYPFLTQQSNIQYIWRRHLHTIVQHLSLCQPFFFFFFSLFFTFFFFSIFYFILYFYFVFLPFFFFFFFCISVLFCSTCPRRVVSTPSMRVIFGATLSELSCI